MDAAIMMMFKAMYSCLLYTSCILCDLAVKPRLLIGRVFLLLKFLLLRA